MSSSCCNLCFFVSGSVGDDVVSGSGNAAGELEEAGSGGCRCKGCCGCRSYCLAFLETGATAPSEDASTAVVNLNRCLHRSRNPRSCSRRSLNRRLNSSCRISNGRSSRTASRQQWLRWHWLVLCYVLIIVFIQCLHNRNGCNGCTGEGVIVKGIIPPEDVVPPAGKVPLPLEVVLDRQVATRKAASADAQSLALLAVARVEVADLDSRLLVASTEVCLKQHTSESKDCLVPGLVHLLVVVRAVEDLVVVLESQVLSLA